MATRKKQDFESRLARLTEIVETLEQEEVPLEKSMALYKEGVELVKACRGQLDKARYEVTVSGKDGVAPLAQEAQHDGETGAQGAVEE